MVESKDSESSNQEIPAIDLKITGDPQPLTIFGFPVVLPKEDIDDKVVPIRGKDLNRWRGKLLRICNRPFKCDDLFLAISMLLLGSYAAVLLTNNSYSGFVNFALHTLLPCLGVGFFIAYIFIRRISTASPKELSEELLKEIPNPDDITISGDLNESE